MSNAVRRIRLAAAASLIAAAIVPIVSSPATHAVGGSDLAVSIAPVGSPTEGGSALFQVTVTNNGPDATNFVIVPGSISVPLNSVTSATAVCAKGRNSVYTCNFGTLASGASGTALVSGKVGTEATVTSSVTVQGSNDTDFTNNRASVTVAVLPALTDIQVGGSASTRSPSAGAEFDLRFQVKNSGRSVAPDVTFTDAIPAELAIVSAGSLAATCDVVGQDVTCNLGTMPVGASATIVIGVQAPADPGVTVNDTGFAIASNGDSSRANNTATVSVTTR